MMLVYNLDDVTSLYNRFGGVAGSAYVVAGVGFNVEEQQSSARTDPDRRRSAARRQPRLPETYRAAHLESVLSGVISPFRSDLEIRRWMLPRLALAAALDFRHAKMAKSSFGDCLSSITDSHLGPVDPVLHSSAFCAGFLALMVAPAIWRRAVALTRKRVEASVPLTLAEIQADKDRSRAEFAMATRRLEMNIKTLREKSAEQLVEINRGREQLKEIAVERRDKNQALSELEAKNEALRQRRSNCNAYRNGSRKPSACWKSARLNSKSWNICMTTPAFLQQPSDRTGGARIRTGKACQRHLGAA
jgi:hypothetical protein